MKKVNICRICLRSDRKLRSIDGTLLEFHDELCEYSIYTLHPLYCLECEQLLRKTYNFKNKCMKAIEIFDNWKKSIENDKKPMEDLCTLLPTSLGLWVRNNNTTCLHYEFNEDQNISIRSESNNNEISHYNIYANDVIKLETECESDLKDHIKTEDENSIEITELGNKHSIKKEFKINGSINVNESCTKETKNEGRTKKKTLSVFCEKNAARSKKKMLNESSENISAFDDMSVNDDGDSDDDDSLTLTALSMKNKIKETDTKRSIKKTKEERKNSVRNGKNSKKRTMTKDKSGKRKKIKLEPQQYSKERLKSELEAKFEAWGELTTHDGTAIDKGVILNCLNDKISDDRMKQLWDSIQCEKPEPRTLRTFKHLIRNYTNEEQYTSVFDIEYLNTDEKMLEELQRRKTYECYVKAKYKCEKCYLVFYKPKHLDNHVKMHEETAGDFVCNICNLRYTSGKNFRGHLLAHSAVYRCKLCPLVTYYRDSMVNHYNQHQGKEYTCEICGNISKSLSGYKRHQYLSHRRGRHVCTACGRAFVSSLGVSLHKKRMHQNEAPPPDGATTVSCSECDLSFPSDEVLLKHKRTWHQAHKGDKTGSETGTYNFKRPRTKKPKPPSITCRACGACGSIGWLSLHFRTEHPTLDMDVVYSDKRTHLCHICAKGFWNATSLRYHLNIHSGLRPYACSLCPTRCHSSIALNEHRLRHFPPTKECKHCGKKFRTPSNLYNHMLFHTGNRRHKCNICGKAFLHSSSLTEHVQGVHYNVRRVKRGTNVANGQKTADIAISGGEMSD